MRVRAPEEGKRFKELRQMVGLSQSQLARKIGDKVQNISRIDQGFTSLVNVKFDKVCRIAEGFGVDPLNLISYVLGKITIEELYAYLCAEKGE